MDSLKTNPCPTCPFLLGDYYWSCMTCRLDGKTTEFCVNCKAEFDIDTPKHEYHIHEKHLMEFRTKLVETTCGSCGKHACFPCIGCFQVFYCNESCRVNDRAKHKAICE